MDDAHEIELLGMAFEVEEISEVVSVYEAFVEEVYVLEELGWVEESVVAEKLFLDFESGSEDESFLD
jgi:hypothetical protein